MRRSHAPMRSAANKQRGVVVPLYRCLSGAGHPLIRRELADSSVEVQMLMLLSRPDFELPGLRGGSRAHVRAPGATDGG